VQIAAPPEEVFEYIADVTHHPAFIPTLNTVEDVVGDGKHGTEWSWSYTMAGVELQGRATTVDFEPGRLYSFRTIGGLESTFIYRVEPKESGTQLTAEVDYQMPKSLLAKVADSMVVERLNDGAADKAVQNLKAIFEG
jgi:carbon monoxide dehydrogenase subunit G